MKILHIISQRPEFTGSGFTLQNIMAQAKNGGHVNSLVAGLSEHCQPELGQLAAKDCFFIRFPHPETNFQLPGMSDVMPYRSSRFSELNPNQINGYRERFRKIIQQAIHQAKPDIIHSHHLWLASAIAKEEAGSIPIITSCHSTDLRQYILCPHLRPWISESIPKIDRILALSQQQAAAIQETFSIPDDRIDSVVVGFDDTIFNSHQQKPSGRIELLYAGKLSYAKGVDWLLRVFTGLADQDIHLHLAGSGEGPEAEHCQALAAGCGSRVTQHGRIDQQALARLMERCHIFVLPSFYEGLPLVLLEALASGCRLLTTDLPGCKELLHNTAPNLTRMVPLPEHLEIDRPPQQCWPQLDRDLKDAILELSRLTQEGDLPATADIQRLVQPFTWQAVFRKIELIYESMPACTTKKPKQKQKRKAKE